MKEQLMILLAKAQENKALLIKVGAAVGGAVLGVVVVGIVSAIQAQQESSLVFEENDTTDEDETE